LFSISFVGKITGTLQGRMFEFLIAKYVSYTSVTSFKMSLSAPENSKILMIRPTVSVTPIVSKLYGSNDYITIKNNFRKIFLFFIWTSCFLLSAFIVFNKNFIDLWIGKKFYISSQINILICILVVVSSFSEILAHLVWSLGEIKKNNIATLVQFLIFLPCGIYASINYGITGLLITSILSYLLVTIWYFLFIIYEKLNYKINNLYTPLKEIIINLLIIISLFYFFNNPKISNWKEFILHCSFFSIIYVTLLFIISNKFRSIVLSLIKR
jgi:O-antigen/teichoic acid export membrane protein